jgi:type II secretion system protein N
MLTLVGLLLAFTATLVFTFPIDAVVERALEQESLDDVDVTFANAGLRWNGVLLEDVEVSTGERVVATVPWVRIRPSLGAILGGQGLPATLEGSTCNGWFDGRVSDGDGTARVAGEWVDLDLATCAPIWRVPGTLVGEVDGRIDLTVAASAPPTGSGLLTLRDASWDLPGMPKHLPVTAHAADIAWRLAGDTLTIHRLELGNDEFDMRAEGTIAIGEPVGRSELTLLVDVTPRPGMPQAHRDLFYSLAGSPPDRGGHRRFRVEGTLSNPVMARPTT